MYGLIFLLIMITLVILVLFLLLVATATEDAKYSSYNNHYSGPIARIYDLSYNARNDRADRSKNNLEANRRKRING